MGRSLAKAQEGITFASLSPQLATTMVSKAGTEKAGMSVDTKVLKVNID